ncbi:3-isopropylmalate dehydratase [Paenibacillus glacialis]|uniref:3-isopropylmalate dehydratase n=2 Tax=Paenibacillus glacialis TaxID=494026 RepID=A0A168DHC1_9BACL|nr:3-isopropylmalate dehydratase [Paenibacillus glacialis]
MFGDNISTDLIVPGRLSHLRSNLPELAKHVLEDADPTFAQKVQVGDYVVAGENFGTGSSREHAAHVIKLAGIKAVIAKSFARIYYRNASNIGLWLITADTETIKTGDTIEIDLKGSRIIVNGTDSILCHIPDGILLNILLDGGLIPHLQKNGGFAL